MKPIDYNPPKPSYVMRLLWKAAGGDETILKQSTYSDQVKYMCLGGIIVATGLMAGIAGGYAFYTIFEPKGSALDNDQIDITTSIISMIFGVVWGTIIFNIDRFIVSSTGKGDGTEAITWSELKGAIPRIIMGAIIALTISKPVEIRMFKSEIDKEVRELQLEEQRRLKGEIAKKYEADLEELKQKKDKLYTEIAKAKQDFQSYDLAATEEWEGKSGTGESGDGPAYRKKIATANDYKELWKKTEAENLKRIQELEESEKEFKSQKSNEENEVNDKINKMDGLLLKIKLAHEIAGFWVSLFITLLFMAIELTPIFFKLMLIKSPYDYIEENIKELAKAKAGIHITYDYYTEGDKQGVERHLVRNLNAEKIINDKVQLLDSQKRLTEYAIQKFEEKIKKQIDENPEDYISFGNEDTKN